VISPPVPGQDPTASPLRRGRPGYDLASVLAVAVEVFNERGYDRTSMRDLAERLGIAKSAIYHHVTGKEELLRLALDRALAGLSAAAERARVLPAPAIERLEYLIRSSVDVLDAELPYGPRLTSGAPSTGSSPSWWRRPYAMATSGRTLTR